jgi:hypothetical protein
LFAASAVAFLLASGIAPPVAAAQAAGEYISQYRTTMQLRRDGTMHVEEEITYDFGVIAHHGIFRDLVERETYDAHHDRLYTISNVSVTADGEPVAVQTSDNNNFLHLRIGDPHGSVTGEHTYRIAYDIEGAARTFPDHQELNWDAVGNLWQVPISSAIATVVAPTSITKVTCFAGPQGSRLPCNHAVVKGRTAVFSTTEIGNGSGLTVVAGLPPGSIVPDPQPILERRRTIGEAFAVRADTVLPAILIAALSIALVLSLAWRRGRDRRYSGSAVDAAFGNDTGAVQPVAFGRRLPEPVEFVPPDGIRPGQVGTLVDEHANLVDVTATIVDLAVRGWLTITDLGDDYELATTGTPGSRPLLGYETELMNALFADGPSVRLSDLKYTFRAELLEIQGAMYQNVVDEGWYLVRPDRTRHRWTAIAVAALVTTVILTVVVCELTSYGLVPLGLVLGAVVLLVVAHRMPSRTAKGRAMFSRVRGFRRLFDEGEQDLRERFAEEHGIFSRYLPYAIAFGCTEKWARVFAQLDAGQLDVSWYHGSSPFDAAMLAGSMNHFGTVATGTLYASQPSSSSSSGFGGGFSGGGGGGGGGGSW